MKDQANYITALGRDQMNTLGNLSMLDIFLSANQYVEPHIHQNASELVYCISGSALVTFINPFSKQVINLEIFPGQTANIPQGFWHYEVATQDHTHLLAIFDAPYPQAIYGSDILRLTPSQAMANSYCLDQRMWDGAISSINQTVIIGPPADCSRQLKQPAQSRYIPFSNQRFYS
ncbi:putative RmlC-like cupin family protein [Alkalihalobacillus xiaoxiensis]|uniref:RmlC-like cupin family protein n=1 Tax=Shouchella xiaoxiensis TaxID=766895 RepID=A0ABS2SQP3_9BACI|nr:putative RmlC-like cupin family protein [Shouchella xiaoxiensis]